MENQDKSRIRAWCKFLDLTEGEVSRIENCLEARLEELHQELWNKLKLIPSVQKIEIRPSYGIAFEVVVLTDNSMNKVQRKLVYEIQRQNLQNYPDVTFDFILRQNPAPKTLEEAIFRALILESPLSLDDLTSKVKEWIPQTTKSKVRELVWYLIDSGKLQLTDQYTIEVVE